MAEKQKTEAKRRGPFELSSDARILYNVLEKAFIKEGKTLVTYTELSAAIQRDVQKEARGLLGTARRLIENQHKVLLEAVMNTGIQKSEETEGAMDRGHAHIHRTSRKLIKRVGNAMNGKPVTASLGAKFSTMNAITLFSGPKAPQKLIETLEQRKLKELSTAETLRLFGVERDKPNGKDEDSK